MNSSSNVIGILKDDNIRVRLQCTVFADSLLKFHLCVVLAFSSCINSLFCL